MGARSTFPSDGKKLKSVLVVCLALGNHFNYVGHNVLK